MNTFRPRLLDYAVAGRAKPGELVSGDLSAVRDQPEGVIVAVVDGLGHGPEAAHAAAAAVNALDDARPGQPISRLMEACHSALLHTRGVALALATLGANNRMLTWLCVGNVEGRLIRSAAGRRREGRSLLMHSGIVGHHLPGLRPTTVALQPGDIIAIATDGIRSEFEGEIRRDMSPQQAAERILACCSRDTDDALVLIGHWIGRDGAR